MMTPAVGSRRDAAGAADTLEDGERTWREDEMTLRVGEIVVDCADHETAVPFWLAALDGYRREDINEQYVAIVPVEPGPGRPVVLFQAVPEPKIVKNRVHLDLVGESMAAEVVRLSGLGATVIAERSLGETSRWTVMADPEGNEFCVAGG